MGNESEERIGPAFGSRLSPARYAASMAARRYRHGDQPAAHRRGVRGARPLPANSAGAAGLRGVEGRAEPPLARSQCLTYVGWLMVPSAMSQPLVPVRA